MYQIVIVGRPNVGKSTLFNALIGEKKSIVEKTPGVTRDFVVEYLELEEGKGVKIIDTGGIDFSKRETFSEIINRTIEKPLKEANLILFVVDGKEGLTLADEEIATFLRKFNCPIWLVINKVENKEDERRSQEFWSLGFKEIFLISAKEKKNIEELKEKILAGSKDKIWSFPQKASIKVTILGRPNVGKSTLVNKLVGYERMIVSEIPGTTRDCVDVLIEREGNLNFLLIDTPGIRRRPRIKERVEKFSVDKALETLRRADFVLFVITAEEGLSHQDKTLLRQGQKHFKPALLLINKWDLFKKKPSQGKIFLELLKKELSFIPWLPVLPISAKEGLNVYKIFPLIEEVYQEYLKRIPTPQVNKLLEIIKKEYTFNIKGKRLKVYYSTQVEIAPPTFVIFCNIPPEEIPSNVEKFFRRKFQEALDFKKVPIKILFKLRS